MALDHSRLGLENKLLENKSGRIFWVRQVYFTNSCQQIWGCVNQPFILFFTSNLRWNSTVYHTDLGQNTVFHNFSRQIALSQCSGDQSWAFSETVQKMSKITNTAAGSHFYCELSVWSSVWMNVNRDTLQHNHEFIIIIFCYLMVSVITMCNLIKRLIRATFF